MRILVIGGTNFIGPHVVRSLTDWGHNVTVFHRGQTESHVLDDVQHIRSSQAAIPVVEFPEAVGMLQPEVVVHMIAMGQADGHAAVKFFSGKAQRIVGVSSGDVYRAFGVFQGFETGAVQAMPLTEESELRTKLYPYRSDSEPGDWKHDYDKILMEKELLGDANISGTILRLPKVYGPETGQGLDHYYHFTRHLNWRWTHGFVENVAHAIALAATHPDAGGKIFNVGEQDTPTVEERLSMLPASQGEKTEPDGLRFEQGIVYDTSRIRQELGYREIVSYEEGINRTLSG